MQAACIDMEGVLIPEMWPHIARKAGIPELAVTSREVPDYAALVAQRIRLLRERGLRLADVVRMVEDLTTLPGAKGFLEALSRSCQLFLVSDAFEPLLRHALPRLPPARLLCHDFVCDASGYIVAADYSRQHGKHEAVAQLQHEGYRVLAVGDAFNDIGMLRLAERGYLFRPSPETRAAAPELTVAQTYRDILEDRGGGR